MSFVVGFIIGIILGALAMCFIVGATRLNKESEIYEQGYLAGQAENMKESKEVTNSN